MISSVFRTAHWPCSKFYSRYKANSTAYITLKRATKYFPLCFVKYSWHRKKLKAGGLDLSESYIYVTYFFGQ